MNTVSGGGETVARAHYREIRERILSGSFDADARIYESVLSEEFGTSRTPIREALSMLEKDGLLVRAQRGYRLHRRSQQEVLDYFDVRSALEAAAAEAAANRASDADLSRMAAMLQRASSESNAAVRSEIHKEWHRALIQASRNAALEDFVTRAEALISLHREPWERSLAGSDQSQKDHEAILEAVAARDPDRARSLMTEHMNQSRDFQLTQLLKSPGRPGGVVG